MVRDSESTNTKHLLEKAGEGDGSAFERLFEQYRSALHRFVALRLDPRLRSRVDPEDVLQETQLEAFRRLSDYLERRPMPFFLWLRKTALERLLMFRRQHLGAGKRSLERQVPLPDGSSLLLAQRLLAADPTASQQLSRRELARGVQRAVEDLPDGDREILLMRSFEELSYVEIGRLLEMDPSTVSKRHGRALLRLHKLLVERGITESEL